MGKIDWKKYLQKDVCCSCGKTHFAILKKSSLKNMPLSSFQEFSK